MDNGPQMTPAAGPDGGLAGAQRTLLAASFAEPRAGQASLRLPDLPSLTGAGPPVLLGENLGAGLSLAGLPVVASGEADTPAGRGVLRFAPAIATPGGDGLQLTLAYGLAGVSGQPPHWLGSVTAELRHLPDGWQIAATAQLAT